MTKCSIKGPNGETCQFEKLSQNVQNQLGTLNLIYILGGWNYCPFHLPLQYKTGQKRKKFDWSKNDFSNFNNAINALIKEKKTNFTGTHFPISLDLKKKKIKTSMDFSKAFFAEELILEDAVIEGSINFQEAIFQRTVKLNGAIIKGDLTFNKATIQKNAELNNMRIDGDAIFTGSTFNSTANFKNIVIKGDALFNKIHSTDSINLEKATIQGNVDFRESIINRSLIFDNAKIGKTARIFQAHIRSAFFENVKIEGDIIFNHSSIRLSAVFRKAKIGGGAFFGDSEIGDIIDFDSSVIKGILDFHNAKIGELVLFNYVTIGGQAIFSTDKNQPFPSAHFTSTTFSKNVDFRDRVFLKDTNFKGATFRGIPIFHGAKIHQGTIFPSQEAFLDTSGEEAALAYRTLKLAMAEQRAYKEEGMFYALEEKSRRNDPSTKKLDKFISKTYEEVSYYGQDYLRPIIWWGLVLIFFFMIYGVIAQFDLGKTLILIDLILFVMEQGIIPFSAWRFEGLDVFPEISANGALLLRIGSFFHGIISISLVALSLLALRWRFKRH